MLFLPWASSSRVRYLVSGKKNKIMMKARTLRPLRKVSVTATGFLFESRRRSSATAQRPWTRDHRDVHFYTSYGSGAAKSTLLIRLVPASLTGKPCCPKNSKFHLMQFFGIWNGGAGASPRQDLTLRRMASCFKCSRLVDPEHAAIFAALTCVVGSTARSTCVASA